MAQKHVFGIRWKEQGNNPVEFTRITAFSQKQALVQLRDKLLLERGIGFHYLWIMQVVDCTTGKSYLHINRVNEILEAL